MIPGLLLLFASESVDIEEALKKFTAVYTLVERQAATPVNPHQAVFEGAIPGMLRRLDPHSVFFPPEQFEQLKEMEKSTHKGFGTVVSVLPGRVIVLQTLPGTPSARAGIAAGDEIIAINGVRLDWLDMEQLVGLLSEARQREAKLDVRRPGSARSLPFTMAPEQLASESVDRHFLLRPGVGYARVTSFESETPRQLREAVEKLGGRQLEALVLDLRNNPGGLLPSALETAAMFLRPGTKILTIRGRATEPDDIKVPDAAEPYPFPVVVLINGKSASGAEIVAGALQDHKRAAIVGEPSFGKGLVQSVYPLAGGTGLALTTAFYFTPNGRSIQRPLGGTQLEDVTRAQTAGGIHPDHSVPPPAQTRLRIVLEASGSVTSFATEFLRAAPNPAANFEVSPTLMDRFQAWLSDRNIRPGVSQWFADADWIRRRLKQEIHTLAFGVAKGDEIEMRDDAQVRKALEVLEVR